MKRVVKKVATVIVVCLSIVSCSKESSAEQDALYETQATEGDNSNDDDKPDI